MLKARYKRCDTEKKILGTGFQTIRENNSPGHLLLDDPAVIAGRALLDASIYILEVRRPLKVLVLDPRLPNGLISRAAIRIGLLPGVLAHVTQSLLLKLGVIPGGGVSRFEAAARSPLVLQHFRVENLVLAHTRLQGDIDAVKVHAILPVGAEVLDHLDRVLRCLFNDDGVMVSRTEGIRQSNGAFPTHSTFHGTADSSTRQSKQRRGVAAIVWTGHHDVNRALFLEVVVKSNLDTACRGRVNQDPFVAAVIGLPIASPRQVVYCPIFLMQGARAEICRFHRRADNMRLTDP